MRDARVVIAIGAGFVCSVWARGLEATLTAYPHWLFGIIASFFAAVFWAAGPVKGKAMYWSALGAGVVAALVMPQQLVRPPGEVVTANVGYHAGDLFAALARLDDDPDSMLGRPLRVSGEWHRPSVDNLATVSRRIMTCCVADAIAVGFDVQSDRPPAARDGTVVFVSGILGSRISGGEVRYVITRAHVAVRR